MGENPLVFSSNYLGSFTSSADINPSKEADMQIFQFFIVDKKKNEILKHDHIIARDEDAALVKIGAENPEAANANIEVCLTKQDEYDLD